MRVLPVLLIAGAVRLFRSERLDFALVLVVISVVGGVDLGSSTAGCWRRGARRAAVAAGQRPEAVPEPGTVDYARSMVPVVVVVLLLRSFLFEPFRIPSDSMMPTLHDGDFILVNKFSYGLRLPVLNRKILRSGTARARRRGGVPLSAGSGSQLHQARGGPAGRPGQGRDRPDVRQWRAPARDRCGALFSDGCYENMRLTEVQTGEHVTRCCPAGPGLARRARRCPAATGASDRSYPCDGGSARGPSRA